MDNTTKQQITEQLRKYVSNSAGGSANKASKMLGISNAYISMMLNKKWDNISDDSWRIVQKQVFAAAQDKSPIAITPHVFLSKLFEDARVNANTFGIIGEAGCGKTFTAEHFSKRENVFHICCNEYFNRKTFLADLLNAMGKDGGGYTVAEMMSAVVSTIRKLDNPLIIMDEADKLSDQVLYFFISLYNLLNGKCGLILMATDHLEKRIEKGIKINRKGYKEIFSRLGRKFIPIPKVKKKDVALLAQADDITDPLTITEIFNESEGDLRRVVRSIYAIKQKRAA